MDKKVNIRSKLCLGVSGNRAEVGRIIRSGDSIFVEVEQTHDAKESTIMVAVNAALKKYEEENDIILE